MKIKVCGMRDSENISNLVALKPDYIGFIFYNRSNRFVADFPHVNIPETIKKVGVFVNEELTEVLNKVTKYDLDCVQLHGDESPEYCNDLRRSQGVLESRNLEVIKAFAVDDSFDFRNTTPYQNYCDYLLFDTKGKDYGGNGIKFNWEILKNYKGKTPYFLSGGIGPEEQEEFISFLSRPESDLCEVVDVNSRFEISPGLKDIKKLKEFKYNLR